MKKLSSAIALAAVLGAAAGYLYKSVTCHRQKVFNQKLLELEMEVMEGEGGICLS